MRIAYKKVKVFKEHCSECGEQLRGNGSIATPYECSCGVWQQVLIEKYKPTGEYELKQ